MDIQQELDSQLSPKGRLLTPSHADWTTLSARWNSCFSVSYAAIVDASCEEDVAAAIKYANANGIPFLAFNGTHGAQLLLNKFKNGIGITTLAMKSMALNEDDGVKTVWIRGSWLSGHVRDEMHKMGKRSTVGTCDSTGLIGPMLGGGHGLLQGRYGLLTDQIVEMRVVLADGSIVTVSDRENNDLFWAMRGTGHNFGIVTAAKYRVYDVPKEDTWSFGSMVFKGDRLQELVPAFNQLLKNQTVDVPLWFPQIMMDPQGNEKAVSRLVLHFAPVISSILVLTQAKPIILVKIVYEGSIEAMRQHFAPLESLKPVTYERKGITYQTASQALDWHFDSFGNQKNVSVLRFPIGAESFSYSAMKNTYDRMAAAVIEQPMLGSSFILWEAYATQAVKAVPDDATAVADRADDMLVAAIVVLPPGTLPDSPLVKETEKLGQDLRECMVGGEELHAYVNYAHGDESLEEMYGHQPWRLERLRKLKKQYDPENRFGFYAPIV